MPVCFLRGNYLFSLKKKLRRSIFQTLNDCKFVHVTGRLDFATEIYARIHSEKEKVMPPSLLSMFFGVATWVSPALSNWIISPLYKSG